MTLTEQVKKAMETLLAQHGIAAAEAFGEKDFCRKDLPCIALGTRQAQIEKAGMLDYLGERYDEEKGTVTELYGRELKLTLSLDVYAESARECELCAEEAVLALLCPVMAGLRVGTVSFEETAWDKHYGCYLRRGTVSCTAFFTARDDGDGTPMRDFVLKGMVGK